MKKFSDFISGELVLNFMPNGGVAILLRTIWISSLLYLSAIAIKSYCSGGVFLSLSLIQFKEVVSETLPWLGAILGGVYAALYTRFASQWAYIADLYNQQMSQAASLTKEQIDGPNYRGWQAAFVEDAICMHLATKDGFRNAISEMLQKDAIRTLLLEHVGEKKILKLESKLKELVAKQVEDK